LINDNKTGYYMFRPVIPDQFIKRRSRYANPEKQIIGADANAVYVVCVRRMQQAGYQ
jgi:hypothetical protein